METLSYLEISPDINEACHMFKIQGSFFLVN
jgi:hypothetical protein